LLVAEKSGFQLQETSTTGTLHEMTERMTRDAMESLQQAALATASSPPASATTVPVEKASLPKAGKG
jgi:hypothetical protein